MPVANADAWVPVASQIVALAAAVFAYYKATHASAKADNTHREVVDVKRATGTNRRATDEADEPVKPEPASTLSPARRHTDDLPAAPTPPSTGTTGTTEQGQ